MSLNGHALTEPIEGPAGNMTDQFLRYAYEVGSLLRASNTLSVVFDQDIDTNARFMVRIAPVLLALPVDLRPSGVPVPTQTPPPSHEKSLSAQACSGGWDWAPYSDLRSGEGHQMLSRGIWKSVYLTAVQSAALLHVTATTTFHGKA